MIDGRQWLWTREARAGLSSLAVHARKRFATEIAAAGATLDEIVARLKELPSCSIQEAIERIRAATRDFQPTPTQRSCSDIMSWEELLSLDPNIVTVGSHSVSHPILTTLTSSELEHEIGGSRHRLEDRIGTQVEHFCYPNGASNPPVVTLVARSYSSATHDRGGPMSPGANRFLLPRIAASPSTVRRFWRLNRWYPPAA